ncbi:MAG: hypothetical protein ABI234_02700 [Ktedonobacteraceae bacterium]
MTRDFNTPRRDDDRPTSSRNTPSNNNNREERPFNPARPRLSRDAVDRAWENGGNRNHADYRTRPNAPRPPFQQQGRPGPAAGRPQAPYNRPGYDARPSTGPGYRGPSSSTPNPNYQRREQGPEGDRRPSTGPSIYRGPSSSTPNTGYRGPSPSTPDPNYQRREQSPEGDRRPSNSPSYRGPSPSPNADYQRREQEGSEGNRRPFNNSSYRGPSPSTPNTGYQRREQGSEGTRRPFNNPSYRGPASNTGYQRRNQEVSGDRRPFNEKEYHRFSEAPVPNTDSQRREQGSGSGERRFNGPSGQQGFQGERGPRDLRGPGQAYRGSEERSQDTRPSHFPPAGSGGPVRNNYRPESGPRPFERGDRERPNFIHGNRPGAPQSQRDNHNPRWQSRPAAQRTYRSAQQEAADAQREQPYGRPTSEQFEGDYERFDSHQGARHSEQAEYEEKHVTPLADGRVIKGSRPSQRKQARFWNGVAEETSNLLANTPPTLETPEQMSEPITSEDVQVEKPVRPRKSPTGKTKAVRTMSTTHDRGTGGMKSIHGSKVKALKRKTSSPQVPGTRPSRRGYKWPAPGGESGKTGEAGE